MKTPISLLPIVLLIFWSCEEKKDDETIDTTPHSVSITFPNNNSTVNDTIVIACVSTDDDEVDGSLKRQRLNVGFSRGKEKLIFVHSKPINEFKSSLKTVLMHYERCMVEGPSVNDTDQKSPMEAKVLGWLSRTAIKNEFGDKMEIIPQFRLGEFLKKIDPSYNHPAYKVDFLLRIKDKENIHHIIIEYEIIGIPERAPRNRHMFQDGQYKIGRASCRERV